MAEEEQKKVDGGSEYIAPSATDQHAAAEMNKALAPSTECQTPSEVWLVAMEQDAAIPQDLEIATKTFKTALQAEYMLNGKTEEIHEEGIAIKYANILGKIGNALQKYIVDRTPITVDAKVQGIVDVYVASLNKEQIQPNLLLEYIRLHFHCFKGCFTTKCLSFE